MSSDDDKKTPCKYGSSCYQRNAMHLKKYSHSKRERSSEHSDDDSFKKQKKYSARPKQSKDASPKKLDEATTLQKHMSDDSSSEKQISDDENSPEKQMSGDDNSAEKQMSGDVSSPKKQMSDDASSPEKKRNKNKDSKREVISSSDEGESAAKIETQEVTKEFKKLKTYDERKKFIKQKFLVDMPKDFYQFWDLCKTLSSDKPKDSFKQAGLTLVGPYDILDESFQDKNYSENEYLLHWRYYYDPPEFQTIIKGDDKTGFHVGYFRDSPEEKPVFVASNLANKNCIIDPMGENIFAALNSYIENVLKTADPFKKMSLTKLHKSIVNTAKDLKINLDKHTSNMSARHRKTVCKAFHTVGIVVPFNRKTELGYRKLPVDEKELRKILSSVTTGYEVDSKKAFSSLLPVLTAATIANDECDFGTGLEFGINLFCYGSDCLNEVALNVLKVTYALLRRHPFAQIAEAHLKNRKKGPPFELK